ncbi:MAG: serine O-acetyltransferase, partial [Clostridia bacterium]|nr:serine O-acetyltransferase [Clostridia bacterium]
MFKNLKKDLDFALKSDPSARNKLEILLTYPGVHALILHRISHFLQRINLKFTARLLSQITRFLTGIEIHPSAQIASGVFIDHGMGVVIGATAIVETEVLIYHGVTLGATGKPCQGKRHPTIGDRCVIYAGATILGGDTVIGDDCIIGGNVWLTHSVSPGTTVIY